MSIRSARSLRASSFFVAVSLVLPVAAWAVNGAGSLFVAGATHTPTHWNIPIGVATNAEIRGVLPAEVGGSLPPTINVIVKSSGFGNTTVIGTRIGVTSNYAFSYTPPASGSGDAFDACDTSIVAYFANGQNANNDLIDDGLQNGSANAAAGFRFLDGTGTPIPCIPVGVEATPWAHVKSLYR